MSRISRILLIILLVLIIYTVHLEVHMTRMSVTVLLRRSQEEDSDQDVLFDVFPHGGLSYRRTASIVTTCLRVMTAFAVVLAVSLLWPLRKS